MKKFTRKITRKTPFVFGWIILLCISLLQLFGVTSSVASHFSDSNEIETVAVDPCVLGEEDSLTPNRIVMSTVHIDLPVVSVPFENGTWKVNSGVANYADGTSRISEKSGNVGIFAHDLENGFSRIKDLKTGDKVVVYAQGYTATYEVTDGHTTTPADVETLFPTTQPVLTLITCEGFLSEQRYVIKAKLISVRKNSCATN